MEREDDKKGLLVRGTEDEQIKESALIASGPEPELGRSDGEALQRYEI